MPEKISPKRRKAGILKGKIISNLKNNHAFTETCPGNEFPGYYVPSLRDSDIP